MKTANNAVEATGYRRLTHTVMSLESGEYIILLKKGGALFRGRKKYAER